MTVAMTNDSQTLIYIGTAIVGLLGVIAYFTIFGTKGKKKKKKRSKKKKKAAAAAAAASANGSAAPATTAPPTPTPTPTVVESKALPVQETQPEQPSPASKKSKKKKKAALANGGNTLTPAPSSNGKSAIDTQAPLTKQEPPQDEDDDDDLDLQAFTKSSKKKKKPAKVAPAEKEPPKPPVPAPAPPPPEPEPTPQPEPETAQTTATKKKRKRKKKKNNNNADKDANGITNGNHAPTQPDQPSVDPFYDQNTGDEEEWKEVSKRTSKSTSQPVAVIPDAEDPSKPVVIPVADPALLIGPKGATIKKIQESSNARLDISKHPMDPTSHVSITGPTMEAVRSAVAQVKDLLDTEADRLARQVETTVSFGSDGVKAVIGKKGAVIQEIERNSGAKLTANIELGTVKIVGEQDQVNAAHKLCKNAIFGEAQAVVELKSRLAVNVVYGPGFATIRQMQTESGAKLDIAKNSTTLKISGDAPNVRKAQDMVTSLLEANAGVSFEIQQSQVGAIYGKAGSNIRNIQDSTGAFVEVSDGLCQIMGTPENVQKARKLIELAQKGERELKPGEIMETLDLGPGTKAVIGRGGSQIAELQKKHRVEISVTEETCKIMGMKAAVEAAAEEIQGIAQPYIDEAEATKVANALVESGDSAWAVTDENYDAEGW